MVIDTVVVMTASHVVVAGHAFVAAGHIVVVTPNGGVATNCIAGRAIGYWSRCSRVGDACGRIGAGLLGKGQRWKP